MPINTEQYQNPGLSEQARKARVEANLKRLDYAEGNGLLNCEKKTLLDKEIYLFISSGGTGHRALRSIKETIEKTIEHGSRSSVRYLVVDCDAGELNMLRQQNVFGESEIMIVPSDGTHDTINPTRMRDDKKDWVDPNLFNETGGDAPGGHEGFNPDGAGAWRQPGRIRLTSPGGMAVIQKISGKIGEFTTQHDTKLKVFFLCSVAGGTGSGTIIDLAYMTRYVLEHDYNTLYSNTRIFGYIFSPTACEGNVHAKRNPWANNNAAMKEIAYLMRLADRGETLEMMYDTQSVTFNKNIFDVCMIVDGDTTAFRAFEKPAKTARDVVVQSILGCMTATVTNRGNTTTLIDSVFSNNRQDVSAVIPRLPVQEYPRYAGYSFNATGFASVKVPVELLTSVVVHNIFKELWDAWNKDPGRNAEIRFLKDCGIESERLIANIQSTDELLEKVEQKSRDFIRKHGIMAMINVAGDAAKLLKNEYIPYANNRARSAWFTRESWTNTTHLLTAVKDHLIGLNNTVWETSKIVLKTFKGLLERENGILTDVRTFENNFNKTLYFCPINLTQSIETKEHADALMTFITGIYAGKGDEITKAFIDEILFTDNLAKLAGVTSRDAGVSAQFDPAGMIRDFIETKFETIINENIEVFLVKFFSGNPQAETTQPDPNDPAREIATDDLKRAAQEIYNTLTTKGAAMATLADGIERRVSSHKFITVPERCEHLFDEIKSCAQNDTSGTAIEVHTSRSRDELLMITMLQGLPAMAFQSIVRSEPLYEANWNTCPGIHIEQCGSGIHNWVNLPNLLYDVTGPLGEREESNLKAAQDDYDAAVALGMVMDSPNYPGQQIKSVCKLNETRDTGTTVKRLQRKEFDEYIESKLPANLQELNLEFCLNELKNKGVISYVNLRQSGDVPNVDGVNLPDNFYYDYAWHTLRQMFHLWHAVKETIPYVEKLKDAIDEKRNALEKEERMKKRIATFTYALRAVKWSSGDDPTPETDENGVLVPAYIRFDTAQERWLIKPDNRNEELLADVKPFLTGSTLQKECKEYFAFIKFAELDDEKFKQIQDAVSQRATNPNPAVWNKDKEQGRTLKASYEELVQRTKGGKYPMASADFLANAAAAVNDPEIGQKIRDFYDYLIENVDQ